MNHLKEVLDNVKREIAFDAAYKNIENMQKAIIDRQPSAIQYMDASYEVVKYAVQKWGYNIRYINNPTEELQLLAVRYQPHILEDISYPTTAVIYEAVLKCDSSKLEQYLNLLRSQYSYAHCDNWDEIAWKLINERPEIVLYIDPSPELIIHAINIIDNVCHIMQQLKLEELHFSEDDKIKIYITAVHRDKTAICFIPNKYHDILIDTFGPEYFEPNAETEKEE